MGDLSRDFSRHEFECPCCGRVKVDMDLVDCLQRMRDLTGKPLTVTSGYRCRKHNLEASRHRGSCHSKGTAADIKVEGLTVFETYLLAEQIPELSDGGIGVYPEEGFVHVDIRRGRARWARVRGRYLGIWKAVGQRE